MDLLGSILGSMEKPPTIGGEERKRVKEQQKRIEKIKEQDKKTKNDFRAKMQERINEFLKDCTQEKYKFEAMEKVYRAIVHEVAEVAGLASFSFGQDEVDRYIMVWKKEFAPSDEELLAHRRGEEWDPEKARQLAQQKKEEELAEEQRLRERKLEDATLSDTYRTKYQHLLGTTAAKDAASKINSDNRAYGCVSSENKRDRRTIEEVMAESRARKKLKTGEGDVTSSQDKDRSPPASDVATEES